MYFNYRLTNFELPRQPRSHEYVAMRLLHMSAVMHQCQALHAQRCTVCWEAWMEDHPAGDVAMEGVYAAQTDSETEVADRLSEWRRVTMREI